MTSTQTGRTLAARRSPQSTHQNQQRQKVMMYPYSTNLRALAAYYGMVAIAIIAADLVAGVQL